MPSSNVCPRCGLGIDYDHDGDCAVCAGAHPRLIAELQSLQHFKREAQRVILEVFKQLKLEG